VETRSRRLVGPEPPVLRIGRGFLGGSLTSPTYSHRVKNSVTMRSRWPAGEKPRKASEKSVRLAVLGSRNQAVSFLTGKGRPWEADLYRPAAERRAAAAQPEGCAKSDVACELRVRVRGSVW
jgi:hypothetical protein